MTTPARRALIAAAALLTLATTSACGSSGASSGEPAKQPANAASPQGSSSKDGGDGPDQAAPADTAASKEFCNRYGEYMGDMRQGGSTAAAALPKLDALMASPPDEFRQWAADVAPWVKAQVRDDSAAITNTAEVAEEATYQISNRCQFVLADM